MRVLLVDDEAAALERLQIMFANLQNVEVVGTATDGVRAASAIEELRPDLVMLDIQMPELTGLALAGRLSNAEERPEIVFVTAFEHFAPDAFDVEAADYLLKPVRLDRLRQAVERARRRRTMQSPAPASPSTSPYERAFWVQARAGQVKVPVESIDWIEAAGDYAMLHTATRGWLYRCTMSNLAERLDPAELTRVHRGAFVRLSKVAEVKREGRWQISLLLQDGVQVPVGPNYAKEVLEKLGAT